MFISKIIDSIPAIPSVNQWSTKRKVAAFVIGLLAFPIVQSINTLGPAVLFCYGVASLYNQFTGNSRQWSTEHRFIILASVPFIGAVYMATAFAGKVLS